MKKNAENLVEERFKKVIDGDRVGIAKQSKDLMERAIFLTLSQYFGNLSIPEIKIEKLKDGMEITVRALCSSVNAPSGIIK